MDRIQILLSLYDNKWHFWFYQSYKDLDLDCWHKFGNPFDTKEQAEEELLSLIRSGYIIVDDHGVNLQGKMAH